MHTIRFRDWICTKCNWKGDYWETQPVRYHGIDWQHCPSCNSIAIPKIGSTQVIKSEPIEQIKEM